jgi:hypothetical protein
MSGHGSEGVAHLLAFHLRAQTPGRGVEHLRFHASRKALPGQVQQAHLLFRIQTRPQGRHVTRDVARAIHGEGEAFRIHHRAIAQGHAHGGGRCGTRRIRGQRKLHRLGLRRRAVAHHRRCRLVAEPAGHRVADRRRDVPAFGQRAPGFRAVGHSEEDTGGNPARYRPGRIHLHRTQMGLRAQAQFHHVGQRDIGGMNDLARAGAVQRPPHAVARIRAETFTFFHRLEIGPGQMPLAQQLALRHVTHQGHEGAALKTHQQRAVVAQQLGAQAEDIQAGQQDQ